MAFAGNFSLHQTTLFVPGAQHLRRDAELAEPIKEPTRTAHRGRILNYLIPRWGTEPMSYFEIDGFEAEFTDWLLDLERIPRKVRDDAADATAAPLSNSLKNNIVETMGLVLAEAKRQRLIARKAGFRAFSTQVAAADDTHA